MNLKFYSSEYSFDNRLLEEQGGGTQEGGTSGSGNATATVIGWDGCDITCPAGGFSCEQIVEGSTSLSFDPPSDNTSELKCEGGKVIARKTKIGGYITVTLEFDAWNGGSSVGQAKGGATITGVDGGSYTMGSDTVCTWGTKYSSSTGFVTHVKCVEQVKIEEESDS